MGKKRSRRRNDYGLDIDAKDMMNFAMGMATVAVGTGVGVYAFDKITDLAD